MSVNGRDCFKKAALINSHCHFKNTFLARGFSKPLILIGIRTHIAQLTAQIFDGAFFASFCKKGDS